MKTRRIRRARPNRSTKTRHDDCTSGLCKACGWDKKRVPVAWREQRSGTPYACKSKYLGREVTLRGDKRPSTVVGCATPLGETIFQHGRRADAYKCQGAFIVRTTLGTGTIETPVPKSVVRARLRHAKDALCPDAPSYPGSTMRGLAQATEREARAMKRHPFDLVGDLPFPHRKGSSACCINSTITPARLDALYAAWRESGEESDYDALVKAVRRALPRDLRATAPLEKAKQLRAAIDAVRDRCWSIWLDKEVRSTQTSKAFQRRVREDQKAMSLAGLPRTRGRAKRAIPKALADERSMLRRMGLVSRAQFTRAAVEKQRAMVVRAFKKYRRAVDFPLALLEGDELLDMATVAMLREETLRR